MTAPSLKKTVGKTVQKAGRKTGKTTESSPVRAGGQQAAAQATTGRTITAQQAILIMGDQLFPLQHLPKPALGPVVMAEDRSFCTVVNGQGFRQHQQKIVLFLASMRSYRDALRTAGYTVHYRALDERDDRNQSYVDYLAQVMRQEGLTKLRHWTVSDRSSAAMLATAADQHGWQCIEHPSPGFVTAASEVTAWLRGRSRLYLADFYQWQRRRLGVLLADDGGPLGGRWSFDAENRQALPATVTLPTPPTFEKTPHVEAVTRLVRQHFADHPGDVTAFAWPTTREQALAQLNHFIAHRLEKFGPYQDALTGRSDKVFHSLLTPALNVGLLTPGEVIAAALSQQDRIPLASLEGFVRQVLGWREFIFGVDRLVGSQQHASNFFDHQFDLSDAWYTGETGLPPLDAMIRKANRTGYAHHIERLMVAGNVMLLAGIHPQAAYRWFMEMFVDSAEWVMGPNVFGMALYSDGGLFATKPYCCASSYWRKQAGKEAKTWQATYGSDWADGLDGLYWNFIHKNQNYLSTNHRTQRMTWGLGRLSDQRRQLIAPAARTVLSRLVAAPAKPDHTFDDSVDTYVSFQ
jgi:deoxyribodipyrimidine photolyase-related protein